MTNQEACDEVVKLLKSREIEFAGLANVVIFIDRFTGAAAFNTDIEKNEVLAAVLIELGNSIRTGRVQVPANKTTAGLVLPHG